MRIVGGLDEQFARLHARSLALALAVPAGRLYWQPPREGGARTFPVYSCGEHLLRSAAAVEQTFGGITVNLWDDPFEWTLPEALPTPDRVAEYLDEAEAARLRAFALFHRRTEVFRALSDASLALSPQRLTLASLFSSVARRFSASELGTGFFA